MAQAAKGSAPFFLPESRNNVKSDGPEGLSYPDKTKVKSRGRVARVHTVGGRFRSRSCRAQCFSTK
jgi:hypothetical protein